MTDDQRMIRHMDNRITVTVEGLPPMTLEQADELRRRLKRAARETVEAFVLSPEPPTFLADEAAVARILADPVAVRELQRPDGIIVIEEGEPMPSAATLNEARGILSVQRLTRAEALERWPMTPEEGSE